MRLNDEGILQIIVRRDRLHDARARQVSVRACAQTQDGVFTRGCWERDAEGMSHMRAAWSHVKALHGMSVWWAPIYDVSGRSPCAPNEAQAPTLVCPACRRAVSPACSLPGNDR